MSNKHGVVTGHEVTYKPNPTTHRRVPADAPRTGVPVSPTQNHLPRHPDTGQFVPKPKGV